MAEVLIAPFTDRSHEGAIRPDADGGETSGNRAGLYEPIRRVAALVALTGELLALPAEFVH